MDTRLLIRALGLREGRRAHHPQRGRHRHRRRAALARRLALPARHPGIHGHQPHRLRPDAHHRRGFAHAASRIAPAPPTSPPPSSTPSRTSRKTFATSSKSSARTRGPRKYRRSRLHLRRSKRPPPRNRLQLTARRVGGQGASDLTCCFTFGARKLKGHGSFAAISERLKSALLLRREKLPRLGNRIPRRHARSTLD